MTKEMTEFASLLIALIADARQRGVSRQEILELLDGAVEYLRERENEMRLRVSKTAEPLRQSGEKRNDIKAEI